VKVKVIAAVVAKIAMGVNKPSINSTKILKATIMTVTLVILMHI